MKILKNGDVVIEKEKDKFVMKILLSFSNSYHYRAKWKVKHYEQVVKGDTNLRWMNNPKLLKPWQKKEEYWRPFADLYKLYYE